MASRRPYAEYDQEVYGAFRNLLLLSRNVNIEIEPPEYVFLGQPGHGKTTVIEAILGHGLIGGKSTKRPVQLNFINNQSCAEPRITFKRDSFLWTKSQEYARDLEYEHRHVFNMSIIDTPAIVTYSQMWKPARDKDHEGGSGRLTARESSAAMETDTEGEPEKEDLQDRSAEDPASSSSAATEHDASGEARPQTPTAARTASVAFPSQTDASTIPSPGGQVGVEGSDSNQTNAGAESLAGEGHESGKEYSGERKKKSKKKEDKKTARMQRAIMELIEPSHRVLVCVEDAGAAKYKMQRVARIVDPKLQRTIFVYTKAHEYLQTLVTTKDLNHYLGSLVAPSFPRAFLTSFPPSKKSSATYSKAIVFKERISEAIKNDMKLLESLQYDKRYETLVGLHGLRGYVMSHAWGAYQSAVASLKEGLATQIAATEDSLARLRQQLTTLTSGPAALRAASTTHASTYLTTLQNIIKGTLEGVPTQNGQTLTEEFEEPEMGEWMDGWGKSVSIQEEWGVPYATNKLYGRHQFERLLSQFRSIATHTEMGTVTVDEIACAVGAGRLAGVGAGLAWVASDIARRKVDRLLRPLVAQLRSRAVHLLQRLADVSQKTLMLSSASSSATAHGRPSAQSSPTKYTAIALTSGGSSSVVAEGDEGVLGYPYLVHRLRALYFNYIEEVAQQCHTKCLDEFYTTRIIYWDFLTFSGHRFPDKSYSMAFYEQKEEVIELARILFKEIRNRITINVLLKFHNNFFVPIQNELWGTVQRQVTVLADEELKELLQVGQQEVRLRQQIARLQETASKQEALLSSFLTHCSIFSHPK